MARILRKVPAGPAETFHEALQSLWLTHLAVNLESLNSAVSFGRIDQYLYPYYRKDLEEGRLTRERARELLQSFAAKAIEHVFLLSERISQYHGGYLVVQAAIVGGHGPGGERRGQRPHLSLPRGDGGLRPARPQLPGAGARRFARGLPAPGGRGGRGRATACPPSSSTRP